MRFYTRSEQDKEADSLIKAYRDAAGLLPIIRKVLVQFDGKVFNCRLEKALQEASGQYIHAKMEYKNLRLYTYYRWQYITLAECPISEMKDGKRINADKLIESATERRTGLLQTAADIERTKARADEINAQIAQIEKLLDSVTANICSEAKSIYGLYARVTRA